MPRRRPSVRARRPLRLRSARSGNRRKASSFRYRGGAGPSGLAFRICKSARDRSAPLAAVTSWAGAPPPAESQVDLVPRETKSGIVPRRALPKIRGMMDTTEEAQ